MSGGIKYDVPDVEPDDRTGLSVWPVLANGERIGSAIEREDGYQPRTEFGEIWYGPVLPFRQSAVDLIKKRFEER